MKKTILLILLLGLRLFAYSSDKPNILFILADDMGQTQVGCYGGPYHTPHIDSLASEGMRFNHAYASAAVCSPTRAAIMTGKHPARLHLTDFIAGDSFPDKPLKQPEWQKFLPLEEITLGEILKTNGYRTALFGKWHLSSHKRPPESEAYNPSKQGFDESFITYKPVQNETDPEDDPHNVDLITDAAVEFIGRRHDNPFLLFVSHNGIHDPIMESRESILAYSNRKDLQQWNIRPEIAAMVDRLDSGVGRILEKLEEAGLSDKTIVVFYGDNGGKKSYADQNPYRMGKGWLYEGGIRVPLIIRYPNKLKANMVSDIPVSSVDMLPTLLHLAGIESGTSTDGVIIAERPEEEAPIAQRSLYWHYPHYHKGSGMKPASAVRKGNFKLIEWHEPLLLGNGNAYELYDLINDPGEKQDLSGTHSALLVSMKNDLNNWKASVGAQMPTPR